MSPVCGAPPESAPGPVEAGFQEVTLPPKTPALLDVEGRDDRDVWFLTAEDSAEHQSILHWDGGSVSAERISCSSGKETTLEISPRELIVRGQYNDGLYLVSRQARRDPKGAWSCADHEMEGYFLPLFDQEIRIAGSHGFTPSPHTLPEPEHGDGETSRAAPRIAGRKADDVWLASGASSHVLHWNGVVWEDRSPGIPAVESIHVSASGVAWLASGRARDQGSGAPKSPDDKAKRAGNTVLRWDPAARAWACLPTPVGFYTGHIRGVNEHDVWLIGGEEIYHWDGQTFQRAVNPIPYLRDAWLSPAGELWLVGGSDPGDPSTETGLVFRTRAGGKP